MTQLCSICPRGCGVDRAGGQFGFCAVPDTPVVARAAPHFGEEPCISGTRGSGAVFFSGCNLRCVFCQNRTISRGEHGKEITVAQLRDIFLRLRDEGVHNINLVTPSHYTRQIAEALSGLELGIPVVWNSSGYECVETLHMLDGLVQVYLPDLKYALPEPAARYSAAADYPQVALEAIREMRRQTGPAVYDADGMMLRGTQIRHLVLPGLTGDSMRLLTLIRDELPEGTPVSLMGQYTPCGRAMQIPGMNRRVTRKEYDRVLAHMQAIGLPGYRQALSAATEAFVPAFDGTGGKPV